MVKCPPPALARRQSDAVIDGSFRGAKNRGRAIREEGEQRESERVGDGSSHHDA